MSVPLKIDPTLITNCEGDKRALRRTIRAAEQRMAEQAERLDVAGSTTEA